MTELKNINDTVMSLNDSDLLHVIMYGNMDFGSNINIIKLSNCGNCAFPQNFHTKKLGEITVFFAVYKLLKSLH